MVIPMVYTHFGYDYLDKVNFYQIHSGVDLNYGRPDEDLGKEIVAMANGEVVFAKDCGRGWGRMIVIYHAAYGCWSRYAHLDSFNIKLGDKVKEKQKIGECGSSGGTWKPHLHFDIIIKELPYWTKYTNWMSKKEVKKYYADPLKYIEESNYLERKEAPIIEWNKKYKIIEKWTDTPTPQELKAGWISYKIAKAIFNKNFTKKDFNL